MPVEDSSASEPSPEVSESAAKELPKVELVPELVDSVSTVSASSSESESESSELLSSEPPETRLSVTMVAVSSSVSSVRSRTSVKSVAFSMRVCSNWLVVDSTVTS